MVRKIWDSATDEERAMLLELATPLRQRARQLIVPSIFDLDHNKPQPRPRPL